jgi:Putative metallopeptidase
LLVLIPGIHQADSSLQSFATWCEQQRGTLAMLTETLSALAIILSTVSSAVAVTKHEGKAANHDMANKASPQNPRDKAHLVIGNILFVGFHEMGHALADQFHLPTLGRAEDAADSFAAIALLNAGSEFSINVLVQAARGLFLSDRRLRQAACIQIPKPPPPAGPPVPRFASYNVVYLRHVGRSSARLLKRQQPVAGMIECNFARSRSPKDPQVG